MAKDTVQNSANWTLSLNDLFLGTSLNGPVGQLQSSLGFYQHMGQPIYKPS